MTSEVAEDDGGVDRSGVLYVESADTYVWEDEEGVVWKRFCENGEEKTERVRGDTL